MIDNEEGEKLIKDFKWEFWYPMCSNKVPFLDPTKPYAYANLMEMRFIILCGFSLNKQRHNHIYSSLPTPSSHTSCERCDNYLVFIHFYPLSTCLCWITIKETAFCTRWIPSLKSAFLMIYPSTVHFCWPLKCKLSVCNLHIENGVWLILTKKPCQRLY